MIGSETAAIDITPSTAMDDLPLLGVQLSFLDTFIDECGGRQKLEGLTTGQICDSFVKPRTKPSTSLCDQLFASTSPQVKRANWFISHCWQYLFLDVVDALKLFFTTHTEDVVVWFDLFSLPQHGRNKIEADWLRTAFTTAIGNIKNVLMILTPWNNPVTLTRAWCVYELYACSVTGSNFNIALPPTEMETFKESILTENYAYSVFAYVKSENSAATELDDLSAIHTAIRDTIGFASLDRMVFTLLSTWMVGILRAQVEATEIGVNDEEHALWVHRLAGLYEDQGLHKEAERVLEDRFERSKQNLGEDHEPTLTTMTYLLNVYTRPGHVSEAAAFGAEALEKYRRICREDSKVYAQAAMNVSMIYLSLGRVEEAIQLFMGASETYKLHSMADENELQIARYNHMLSDFWRAVGNSERADEILMENLDIETRLLGEHHPNTLTSLFLLARRNANLQNFEKALRYGEKCLEGRRRVLGDDHPDTIRTVLHVAKQYNRFKRYAEAEALYLGCLGNLERVFGKDDVLTLTTYGQIGVTYQGVQKHEHAHSMFHKSFAGLRRTKGDDDVQTLFALSNYAGSCLSIRNYEECESIHLEGLERMGRLLGEDHPDRISLMSGLISLYEQRKNALKVEEWLPVLLRLQRSRLGEDHPDTIISINNLSMFYHEQGKLEEAHLLGLECLEKHRRVYGNDYRDTIICIENVAVSHHTRKEFDAAETLYREAFERARRMMGDDSRNTGKILKEFIALYRAKGE
ncbi:Kinesin light chain 3 [Rhizophlyctis rosea]|nr:Kinesin light chain 3 [Rhizophlyctis rosea]